MAGWLGGGAAPVGSRIHRHADRKPGRGDRDDGRDVCICGNFAGGGRAIQGRDNLCPMRLLCLVAAMAAALPAQTAPPNASGISIGHIHLIVGDPDAQRKLFVDMLGGEVKHAGPLEMWKFPGAYIVIQKAPTAPAEGSDGSTVNHFGFLVKSYPEIRSQAHRRGCSVFKGQSPR